MNIKPRPIRTRIRSGDVTKRNVQLRTQRKTSDKNAGERADLLHASLIAQIGDAALRKRGIKLNSLETQAFHSAIAEKILGYAVDYSREKGEFVRAPRREILSREERAIVTSDTRLMRLLDKLSLFGRIKRARIKLRDNYREPRLRTSRLRSQCRMALGELREAAGFTERQRGGEIVIWKRKWKHLLANPSTKSYFSEWVALEMKARPERYGMRVQKVVESIFQ